MEGRYPYRRQSHYPHLQPADVHIWEKFLAAEPDEFESVDYDVPVGPVPAWFDAVAKDPTGGEASLYRKKVDVVAYSSDYIAAIEVKPFAEAKALGQALAYGHLYRIEHPNVRRVVPMVITNAAQGGYGDIFGSLGVRLEEVGVCERCKHYPSR